MFFSRVQPREARIALPFSHGAMPLKKIVGAAALAGLLAALLAAGFHSIFTEPLIDRAVAIEARSTDHHEEPVVGRPAQKFGLFAGFVLYGLAWGVLFGVLLYAAGANFTRRGNGWQVFILALLLGWSVALFPLLKYPANPPGVGEAATIGYRQELFLLAIALALVGTVGAILADAWLRRSRGAMPAPVIIGYAIYLLVVYIALPVNPDPVKLDAALVRDFRLLSLAGQLLFWTALGGGFLLLARRSSSISHG